MRMLLPAADAAGWSLIAPRFDKARYPAYQRLGREQGYGPDEALLALAASVEESFGLPPVFDLFGFSGGAQFAHRFTMVAPSCVRRLAVAAAGWYTLPDTQRRFPHGVAPAPEIPVAPIRIDRYAAVPQLVLVGDRDITRDSNLRRGERLDREQGRHRVERAIRWHRTMRRVSIRHGCDPDIHRLRLMPDVGHDFTGCVTDGGLAQHLFDFLTCEEQR
jgi:pimeloyl-ACP methyl ester carboxylesterase